MILFDEHFIKLLLWTCRSSIDCQTFYILKLPAFLLMPGLFNEAFKSAKAPSLWSRWTRDEFQIEAPCWIQNRTSHPSLVSERGLTSRLARLRGMKTKITWTHLTFTPDFNIYLSCIYQIWINKFSGSVCRRRVSETDHRLICGDKIRIKLASLWSSLLPSH